MPFSLLRIFEFVRKSSSTKKATGELATAAKTALIAGEDAIDVKYVQKPEADAALTLAQASSKLIASLKGVHEAAIRSGPILVVKVTRGKRTRLAVETISPQLRRVLDKNPMLMNDPQGLFDRLAKMKAPVRELSPETNAGDEDQKEDTTLTAGTKGTNDTSDGETGIE